MRICLAQVRSETGAVDRNVSRHLAVLGQLAPGAADLVVFPELSLSNYDPEVAGPSAVRPDDDRLAPLQRFADETGTAVAVGAPLRSDDPTGAPEKPRIALLVFGPGRRPVVVAKTHLHADEAPYFSPSGAGPSVLDLPVPVGVAICYEVTVAAHADALVEAGAAVYLASVAKTPAGVAAARATLAETARRHGVPALMVNSVGTCEGERAGGGSLVIDREGRLVHQLGASDESLLVYDTESGTATVLRIGP